MSFKLSIDIIQYISSYIDKDIILILRALCKDYNLFFESIELHRQIRKCHYVYNSLFEKAIILFKQHTDKIDCIKIKKAVSKHEIELDKIINEYQIEINRMASILLKNKAYVYINKYYKYVVFYINSRTNEICVEAFGENHVKLQRTKDVKYINKYQIKNYEIYNDIIYFLLVTIVDNGWQFGRGLTYKEALALNKAFKKAETIFD